MGIARTGLVKGNRDVWYRQTLALPHHHHIIIKHKAWKEGKGDICRVLLSWGKKGR